MKSPFSWLKSRLIVFLHDTLMVGVAWVGAYWLHFNIGTIPASQMWLAGQALPLVLIVQVVVYWSFGLYRGIWRFASLPDLMRIIKSVIVGILLSIAVLFANAQLMTIPRVVFLLYALLLIISLGGSRFIYRWLKDRGERGSTRVLIVGAGRAGEWIARDIQRDISKKYQVAAFVDDGYSKIGQEIHGVRVIGQIKDIPMVIKQYQIDMIMIAIPSASSAQMRHILSYCEQMGLPVRTLPGLKDLTNGRVKIDALREVSLEDLLGRDPISLDWRRIWYSVENKSIMVTGGGGSIGSELCRQILRLAPKQLIVLEQNEFNLYILQLELQQNFPKAHIVGRLIDVTDRVAVHHVFSEYPVDMVFHAAAYKHVPMLECQLRSAMKNNILGTQAVVEESIAFGVKEFILISTDKAVNPANIMGASKRAAEVYCQNYNAHSNTRFITVRFGNVLGSAGSVVPLFRKQIEMGGPVTVTHPEIIRYFMTIPEACQLILQATVIGEGGEIFVLDMGEPVKISYLAEQMILLAGLKPHEDIAIHYTGLRPGEKLYEELFHESESLSHTSHEKILRADYRAWDWDALHRILQDIEQGCHHYDEQLLWRSLVALVPEYRSDRLAPDSKQLVSELA